MGTIAIVACAAGGIEDLEDALIRPLREIGHQVTLTATPTAHAWLRVSGDVRSIEELTGHSVRSEPRLPGEESPHPAPDVIVCAPATANTVAKLALGIADNQALTLLCENVATKPMVVFPRINAGHARQPAWAEHVKALESAGVHLVYGADVWPLYEPRQAPPGRSLPWEAIVERTTALLSA